MRIGDNLFEAEGNKETVQAQFEMFKELVLKVPSIKTPAETAPQAHNRQSDQVSPPNEQLDKIMKVDGRIVSLTVAAETTDDAVMLLMYGQKIHRNNDSVTGSELMDGLKVSGQAVERIDRIMEKASKGGFCIILGHKRSKRYRLTNKGISKAREIAQDRIALVA
ncbi:MAG: hypothetical protein F4X93_07800 [Proteobacteria bacterium]|nr:hypothetical protein [Pseudomonadota bacterium]